MLFNDNYLIYDVRRYVTIIPIAKYPLFTKNQYKGISESVTFAKPY